LGMVRKPYFGLKGGEKSLIAMFKGDAAVGRYLIGFFNLSYFVLHNHYTMFCLTNLRSYVMLLYDIMAHMHI
jgi:hypothetical protein